jgi:RNA polymerase sigma-70 factor (ECF subfamily)
VAIDAARSRRLRPTELPLGDIETPVTLEEGADAIVADLMMHWAFGRLSDDHKLVLSELYGRGISPDALAADIGVPVGTVKSRAHYAVRSIKAAMDSDG